MVATGELWNSLPEAATLSSFYTALGEAPGVCVGGRITCRCGLVWACATHTEATAAVGESYIGLAASGGRSPTGAPAPLEAASPQTEARAAGGNRLRALRSIEMGRSIEQLFRRLSSSASDLKRPRLTKVSASFRCLRLSSRCTC